MKGRIVALFMLLIYFLSVNPAMAFTKTVSEPGEELISVDSPVVVIVMVKGEKFVPFIRIIDSRRRLLKNDDIIKIEPVTWWKGHLRNYLYESSGGDLPVKL